ncbi:MAG: hypothetical protein KDD43_07305 [Bdellovibrionales bacterium]|nr:hypothetical protein [Bdellovibrionales bacterium]
MNSNFLCRWLGLISILLTVAGAGAAEPEVDHYMGMTPDEYFGLLLSSTAPSPYANNPETPLDLLLMEARQICKLPQDLDSMASEYLLRYVGQAVYPEWRMAGDDFVRGFNHENQSYEYQSYCVVAFMNRSLDRNTDIGKKIIEAARQGGTLPDRQVAGFNRAGDWQFEPLIAPIN